MFFVMIFEEKLVSICHPLLACDNQSTLQLTTRITGPISDAGGLTMEIVKARSIGCSKQACQQETKHVIVGPCLAEL